MRRAPFVIGATAIGLAAVLSFHTHGTALSASTTPSTKPPGGTAQAHPTPRTTSPAPAGGPGPTTTTPSSSPAAPSGGTHHAVGSTVQYGYGQLSVRVTVVGSKITDVALQSIQTADQYSQQLADQVVPMLRRQVLSAQSANINGISGATYTSEAYARSLQAALDHLGVK